MPIEIYGEIRYNTRVMRTTIDIPDTLYKSVRTRTANEGTTLRNITIALYGDWMRKKDWHPQLDAELLVVTSEPKEAKTPPKRHLKCFGILKPKKHANGPHDMESIRRGIAEGLGKEYKALEKRRHFV